MKRLNQPFLGAAYYPEDWPAEQVDGDIALMLRAGMKVMRIGEFAWSRMEPEEGSYDWAWLHRVVNKLGKAGIAVIMCTPTCTPPAWLSQKHPEILAVNDQGIPAQHGARRHACPTNPIYRKYVRRIVSRMGKEFGRDANIIGWQIDNELYPYGKRGCCCAHCQDTYRNQLRKQFGSVAALNQAWGTNLWSQTYNDFSQVPLPPRADTWHHPSLLTSWMQFQSRAYVDFSNYQADILHKYTRKPVGTDMMPYGALNYYDVHRKLDIVQFNHYNSMENLWESSFWMDLCRSLKERPFWNTETATCWNGSTMANGVKKPGFNRVNSWMPIALGGEANLYWLWRAHWSGQELMHGSVVSSCGRPLHIFDEVREVANGFSQAGEFLSSTRPSNSGLALHFSGLAYSMFEFQPMVAGFNYLEKLKNSIYRPLIRAQFRPDVIDPAADLDAYRLLLSPFLPTLEEAKFADKVLEWVRAGGTWVVGPLSDIRTREACKYTHAPYGHLEAWTKIVCRYELPGAPADYQVRWNEGSSALGSVWYDGLEPRGAEVLALYADGPLAGLAAAVRQRIGQGQIVVLGTLPREQELVNLIGTLGREVDILPYAGASPNLLVVPRSGENAAGLVAIELENQPARLPLERLAVDLLSGELCSGEVAMPPYSVRVLQYDLQPFTNE